MCSYIKATYAASCTQPLPLHTTKSVLVLFSLLLPPFSSFPTPPLPSTPTPALQVPRVGLRLLDGWPLLGTPPARPSMGCAAAAAAGAGAGQVGGAVGAWGKHGMQCRTGTTRQRRCPSTCLPYRPTKLPRNTPISTHWLLPPTCTVLHCTALLCTALLCSALLCMLQVCAICPAAWSTNQCGGGAAGRAALLQVRHTMTT
jgi:hypothetical protein